ncbi:glycosyl transferase family 2 [Paenibacillus curdlanolyticus YK9]|uniref:4,4'-diaponeurosporenoate glycosyltransferase n=1 Tax=Paenibacillus curdlanolyticus YK9 TaxID=717606 RepID=E0I4M5_9BACL|nr:glycosyltransferase [Paenibacillus curdlanolyticus]EFM12556.1 glycosyl transferase family 2 [Paenibacillus curdlanolyticus YK9]
MWIVVLGFMIVGCVSGFILFRKNTLPVCPNSACMSLSGPASRKISVIIPARNEERNLPFLLESLLTQRVPPYEIIVVDDGSEDQTRAIAQRYGVKAVENSALPEGWTGKSWAVWNGYLQASGDVLVFLDADIRLQPQAMASLLHARERSKGVISVVPFHHTERVYERLALIMNMLGIFAFTSVFERHNPSKGLYGSCIVALREDYERINGHASVKSEVLDDLLIGSKFMAAGIPVTNFIGHGVVSFRMYPGGIRSQIEGFSKGAVLSTATLKPWTIVPIAIWVVGLLASYAVFFVANTSWAVPMLTGYVLYTAQLFYFMRYVGRFGFVIPVLHVISSLFFIGVMLYSLYQVVVVGHVRWKGRLVRVGGKRE